MNNNGVEWFRKAKFGMFIHYGLYSLLGRGEWVQYHEKIPVGEYAKQLNDFTAEKLDFDEITDLACAAGMKYVNLTTQHHDGFCLFETKQTDFNTVNAPCRRDFVAELSEQCAKKDLGLCLYYSHGRHWRHPHAMTPEKYDKTARPAYEEPEPAYASPEEHDINKFVDYCHKQVSELLRQYGLARNIWFDGWGTPMAGPWEEELKIPELYARIKELQPECVITYKLGLTGTEDAYAPEFHWPENFPEKMQAALESGKPVEVCHHIAGWGYTAANDGKHRGADSVMADIEKVWDMGATMLLNIAPRPDGSLDPQDVATLKEVGKRVGK